MSFKREAGEMSSMSLQSVKIQDESLLLSSPCLFLNLSNSKRSPTGMLFSFVHVFVADRRKDLVTLNFLEKGPTHAMFLSQERNSAMALGVFCVC